MRKQRSGAESQVAELLATARQSLGLSVAFLARMEGPDQYLEVVDSGVPFLFQEGSVQARETSLCQAILDGKVPQVVTDLRDHPEAMKLPAARFPRIRSYISVPVRLTVRRGAAPGEGAGPAGQVAHGRPGARGRRRHRA